MWCKCYRLYEGNNDKGCNDGGEEYLNHQTDFDSVCGANTNQHSHERNAA